MKKSIFLILSLHLLLDASTLETTIDETLATNPIVLEKLKKYNATKQDIVIAKSGYYPKLDLSVGVGSENTQRTQPDKSFDFSVYQNSLTLTQNVFKGFETIHKVAQEEYKNASTAYSYIEQVNNISFEIVNAYIQIIKNRELLENAQENIKVNQEIFAKVQKLYNSGLTTLSEVNKVEASLALAKANYVVQENTLLDHEYKFEKLFGKKINTQDLQIPTLNATLPSSLEEATQYALQNNPSILVSDYNIKLARASYNEKKSPYYPKVDIEVAELMNKNLSGVEGKDDRFRAMVYLRYNFFNGFADQAALQKSISEMHKENEIQNSLKRNVTEQIGLAWASNEKVSQQLAHLQTYQNFASKTLALYIKEYDLGRRSLLDLLSAQNDFIGAKSQIINAKYTMLFAKYRILDSMGTLVSTVLGEKEKTYSKAALNSKEDILPF
ncbi:MAG: TolC family outer membrane protein [Sulfurimonas sp.]|uniref:TolC family outer membrane protein n=1 Tax=Sulfurimonas sp. TaxID=2022749 RepID=UPI00261DFA5F|nr:TolC family outer membrane protein [Sulfurimonas sp.]MDD5373137.1 TolC family outer membrane protein [Sulfurimonas sp.]